MSTEDRTAAWIRRTLSADAAQLRPETGEAFRTVVARRARRRRHRRVVVVAATAIIALAVGAGIAGSAGLHLGSHATPVVQQPTVRQRDVISRLGRSPLTGEWQSAPVASSRVTRALERAGIPPARTTTAVHGAQRLIIQVTFGGTVDVEIWDPSNAASTLDLLPHLVCRHESGPRLDCASLTRGGDWTLGYSTSGSALTLRPLSALGVGPWPDALAVALTTATPLVLVR